MLLSTPVCSRLLFSSPGTAHLHRLYHRTEAWRRLCTLRAANRINLPRLDSRPVYWTFTILGSIGTIATFVRIFRALPPIQAALYIYLGQANRLKNTLYDDYSAGIFLCDIPGTFFGVSGHLSNREIQEDIISSPLPTLFFSGATVLISSRLILIATLVVSAFLITYGKRHIKISPIKLGICAYYFFSLDPFPSSTPLEIAISIQSTTKHLAKQVFPTSSPTWAPPLTSLWEPQAERMILPAATPTSIANISISSRCSRRIPPSFSWAKNDGL